MVTNQDAPQRAVLPNATVGHVMSSAKEEEGPVQGEFWAVLRAVGVLIGVIVLVGLLIA